MNGRKARDRRRTIHELSARARQLIEEARADRAAGAAQANREYQATLYHANRIYRAELERLREEMVSRIAAIERGDRSGILVAQRIET